LNHATNSSSTHSIILAGSAGVSHDGPEQHCFGWEPFLQSTYDEKIRYFAQMLYGDVVRKFGSQMAGIVTKELFGKDSFSPDGYADHQSVLGMPVEHDGNMCLDFWKDYAHYIASDKTAEILGGNDNEPSDAGTIHPDHRGSGRWCPLFGSSYGNIIARKQGDVWALFNSKYGTKLHLAFDNKVDTDKYGPETPELVDFKITNRCYMNCKFCVVPGTQIETDRGCVLIENIQLGDGALVYDASSDSLIITKVSQVFEREVEEELVEICLDNDKKIIITENHEVYTINRGWIKAGELTEKDELIEKDEL
jgi:hypothetical protein